MKKVLIVAITALSVCAFADSANQTDWSGGYGVQGPVTNWGDEFYSCTQMNYYTTPGMVELRRIHASPSIHDIGDGMNGLRYNYPADVDDDGDTDVMYHSYINNEVGWFENTDGSGTSWDVHIIEDYFESVRSVYPGDINGDGYLDACGADYGRRDTMVGKR